jgi:repressor LexA
MASVAERLSERQRNILDFIVEFVKAEEYPPTIREIGEKVGISSTSVVNYNLARLEELSLLNRRKEKSRGLSLNWDHLLSEGLVEEAQLPSIHLGDGVVVADAHAAIRIPVLGPIAAGAPIEVVPNDTLNADDWLEVTEGMLGPSATRNVDRLYALRVQGDSMIDASVMDGDIVILRHQERAENGEMVAAWIEGDEETTLKYWHLEGDQVRLQPANDGYQPILRQAEKVRVQGKVVGVYRAIA